MKSREAYEKLGVVYRNFLDKDSFFGSVYDHYGYKYFKKEKAGSSLLTLFKWYLFYPPTILSWFTLISFSIIIEALRCLSKENTMEISLRNGCEVYSFCNICMDIIFEQINAKISQNILFWGPLFWGPVNTIFLLGYDVI